MWTLRRNRRTKCIETLRTKKVFVILSCNGRISRQSDIVGPLPRQDCLCQAFNSCNNKLRFGLVEEGWTRPDALATNVIIWCISVRSSSIALSLASVSQIRSASSSSAPVSTIVRVTNMRVMRLYWSSGSFFSRGSSREGRWPSLSLLSNASS